jgi:hypothetical protein
MEVFPVFELKRYALGADGEDWDYMIDITHTNGLPDNLGSGLDVGDDYPYELGAGTSNEFVSSMTLKYKSAGILTAGNLLSFAISLEGTFYYPITSVAAVVDGDYEVYRTGKTDTRYMNILYKGAFTAVGTPS